MTDPEKPRRIGLAALLLATFTFLAFAPVLTNNFIRYDDRIYVTDNPRVLSGLSAENLGWALTTGYASNWHPVTWISHMLDVQLFGLHPAGHHLTSLLLHVVNGVLLFLFLQRATGAFWRSWLVAALFALHPLRVESVAWVAERKDVLSACFLFLTLLCYTQYTRTGPDLRRRYYAAAVLCFALGLMSKPMLVTVPFLLLLLDFWPLQRWTPGPEFPKTVRSLLWEKVPFFLGAAVSIIITLQVQQGAKAAVLSLPLLSRVENAVASYGKYLGKTFWPVNLAVFYPHPDTNYPQSEQWPSWAIMAAAGALLAVCIVCWRRATRFPWLATGWFWYLGLLVPVIGIVQVGRQAMADRYTYLPLIGIGIILVWGLASLAARLPALSLLLRAATPCVLLLLAFGTARQSGFWKDNLTLFEHAQRVTRNNAVAYTMVGIEYGERGAFDRAVDHFQMAIQAAPGDGEPHFGLGYTYELLKQPQAALEQYRLAAKLQPNEARFHNRLGEALRRAGAAEEARAHFVRAVELNPDDWQARVNLGSVLAQAGDLRMAEAQFALASRIAPFAPEPQLRLAENFMKQGRAPEAELRFRELVRQHPGVAEHRINLGGILWFTGRHAEALTAYREAVRLSPNYAVAHYNLGITLLSLRQFPEAAAHLATAVRLQPDHAEALTGWGRALAAMGQTDEALRRLQESLAVRPDGFTLQQLARVYLLKREPQQGVNALMEALKLRPEWPPALNDLAWLWATHPDPVVSDPARALGFAEQAVHLTATNNAEYLGTLDAAFARNGKFEEAIATASQTIQIATQAQQPELAHAARERLKLYHERRPFLQP